MTYGNAIYTPPATGNVTGAFLDAVIKPALEANGWTEIATDTTGAYLNRRFESTATGAVNYLFHYIKDPAQAPVLWMTSYLRYDASDKTIVGVPYQEYYEYNFANYTAAGESPFKIGVDASRSDMASPYVATSTTLVRDQFEYFLSVTADHFALVVRAGGERPTFFFRLTPLEGVNWSNSWVRASRPAYNNGEGQAMYLLANVRPNTTSAGTETYSRGFTLFPSPTNVIDTTTRIALLPYVQRMQTTQVAAQMARPFALLGQTAGTGDNVTYGGTSYKAFMVPGVNAPAETRAALLVPAT